MKSTVELLTPEERKALVLFYDTRAHKALIQLIQNERLELAKDHVDQTDINQVRYLSGQVASLKKLAGTLKSLYQESLKNDK